MKAAIKKWIAWAILCAVPFSCLGDMYPGYIPSWVRYGPNEDGYRLGLHLEQQGIPGKWKLNWAEVYVTSSIIPQGLDRSAFIREATMSFEFVDDRGNLIPALATFYDTWHPTSQSFSYRRVSTKSPTYLGSFRVRPLPHHPLAPGHYLLRLRIGLQFVDGSYVELTSGAWDVIGGSDGQVLSVAATH